MSELSDRIKKDYPGDGNNQNLDMVFASLSEKKQVELMVIVNIEPIKCYSADSRSDLVMIDEEKEDITGQISFDCCGEDGCPVNI